MSTAKLVTYDKSNEQSVEATGHPTDCTEPVPGSVTGTAPHSVTVKNSNGDEKALATYDHATLHFDNHSHDYTSTDGCHDNTSHDLDKTSGQLNKGNWSSSISITPTGESDTPVLVAQDEVATDPKTMNKVNVTDGAVNQSLTENNP